MLYNLLKAWVFFVVASWCLLMTTSSMAEVPEIQRPSNFQEWSLQDQRFALMKELVVVAYQDRFGSKKVTQIPSGIPLTYILGTDGRFYSNGCGCSGVTHWSKGTDDLAVVIVEDTRPLSNDYVLAHELTHVLQVFEDRWVVKQRGEFEIEADIVASIVETQMRILGAPVVLGGR